MPLYDYLCKKCGAVTEVRHGAGEKFAGACAVCGSTGLQRVFNPAPIHFKGSGFYATDSRKTSAPAKAEAGTGEAKTGEPDKRERKEGTGDNATGETTSSHPERARGDNPSRHRGTGETSAKPESAA